MSDCDGERPHDPCRNRTECQQTIRHPHVNLYTSNVTRYPPERDDRDPVVATAPRRPHPKGKCGPGARELPAVCRINLPSSVRT